MNKHNVVFLFADQMHAFAMGCMGNKEVQTPNLDKLASQGVLFRNMYSCAPVCTPYRGTLFTGKYASQSGVESNVSPLPADCITLADRLNQSGCRTSYVGKWHLGGKGNIGVPAELRGGFQDFIGYQCYNDFLNGVCFFDENEVMTEYNQHRTDVTTDLAIERLSGLKDDHFALFVSYQNPHYPVQPSEQYEQMYRGASITRRPNAVDIDPYTGTESPRSDPALDPNKLKYGGNLDEYLRLYYAMITQLDHNVGRILTKLEELGLADNTVVVFTSDHGDMQGSHGMKNKSVFWEESVRVPLIVRAPGGLAGRTTDRLVSSVDLYTTLLHYSGQPCDSSVGTSFAGLSFNADMPWNDTVFSEDKHWRLIRKDHYKLVINRSTREATHFFNLENDPYEMNNQLANPEYTGLIASMQSELIQTFYSQST
jgi:arylsulfatase A-like enzyme